jgi:hypothetical protein
MAALASTLILNLAKEVIFSMGTGYTLKNNSSSTSNGKIKFHYGDVFFLCCESCSEADGPWNIRPTLVVTSLKLRIKKCSNKK